MRRFFKSIQTGGSGSEEIFEELLLAHIDRLYAFACRLTRDQDAAEDLVQEASLNAFKAFAGLRERKHFKNWIFQILRNTFFDRNARRDFEPIDAVEDVISAEDGETLLVQHVLLEEIREALDRLPGVFRVTIWLADVEGFAQKEVAEILGCSIGTVGSRLFRGRAMLRQELMSGHPGRQTGRPL